jgi:hypothetical protein
MDLGARAENVLNSPESAVASKGEVDSNTPGAYPADADTPVTETGPDTSNPAVFGSKSTHNKLHKRNEPRGWAEDTTSSGLGHKHTDSGVGLTQEHETSPTRQPAAVPETETEGAYTYSAPGTTGAGTQSQPSYGQADPVLHPRTEGERDTKDDTLRDTGVFGGVPLASHRQAEEDRQRTAQTTQSEPSTATQGLTGTSGTTDTTTGAAGLTGPSGTADTTTGTTGERETAKAAREPGDVAQEHPYWGDLPRGAGVYNSVTGHGSEEDQRKRQQELYKQETEGLSGQHPSTVAGLSDPSKTRDTIYQTGTSTGLTEESPTQRDTLRSDDQKDSRKKETLIGAGGAATATAAAATAYKMHERDSKSEEARETKSEERPVEEKKERRRSFGLFHRTSKEAEDDHHEKEKAKEEKVKEEKAKPVEEAKHEKKHRFGGLFHRSSVSEDKHHDTAAKDLKEQEEADKTRDDSHKGAYAATGAAGLGAGAGAAYLATRDRDEQVKERSATEPERSQVLGTQTEPERQYQDTTTRPAQGFDEREPKDSHKKTGAAAATAAAAGSGAVFSRRSPGRGG